MAMRMIRLWGVVLLANLVGTYLFALCVARVHIFSPEMQQTLTAVSRGRPWRGILGGGDAAIFAGWLIALMVWLLPGAESARVSIIIILDLFDWARRLQPCDRRIDQDVFSCGLWGGELGILFGAVSCAHIDRQYYWRGFVGGVFGTRAGGGREGGVAGFSGLSLYRGGALDHCVTKTVRYISPIEMMEYLEANAFTNFSSAVTKSTSRASASAM